MTKIRTENDLQNALDRECAWRIQEISDLKLAIQGARHRAAAKTLIRAGAALLYAHWEGFVKAASEHYLEYLSAQRLPYEKLQRCYIAFGVKGRIAELAQTKKPQSARAAVDFILDSLTRPARIQFRGAVDTESNLRSHVFTAIAGWIGVNTARYETKFTFIDTSLCDRRNSIAHGEFLDVDSDSYRELSENVVQLIRDYKTDLENLVTLKSYLA